jgi:uncharacterized repeat protein (TIGR03803 family)
MMVAAVSMMLAEAIAAPAQTYRVLDSFIVGQPMSGLVADTAGNLYGTTLSSGLGRGFGTVFERDRTGALSTLYSFSGGADGSYPYAPLLVDRQGVLYGTTSGGGSFGLGTVFKVGPTGEESVLYSFAGGMDGANPYGGLIRDSTGNFYGTTLYGGGGTSCYSPVGGCGTVFKLDKSGTETVLYRFSGDADGAWPYAGVLRDEAGNASNLYGTTLRGGDSSCDCGTVFELDVSGAETVLHKFTGKPDGASPYGGLIEDGSGNLYGTTEIGGSYSTCPVGCGTVFKLDGNGNETVLYNFTVGEGGPVAGLVMDAAGNLYGTTENAGSSCYEGCGEAFMLDSAGKETILHFFTGPPDGEYPAAGLLRSGSRTLYGTTSYGGPFGGGTVFAVKP